MDEDVYLQRKRAALCSIAICFVVVGVPMFVLGFFGSSPVPQVPCSVQRALSDTRYVVDCPDTRIIISNRELTVGWVILVTEAYIAPMGFKPLCATRQPNIWVSMNITGCLETTTFVFAIFGIVCVVSGLCLAIIACCLRSRRISTVLSIGSGQNTPMAESHSWQQPLEIPKIIHMPGDTTGLALQQSSDNIAQNCKQLDMGRQSPITEMSPLIANN